MTAPRTPPDPFAGLSHDEREEAEEWAATTMRDKRLRLVAMATDRDGRKWDLSPNDRSACKAGAMALLLLQRLEWQGDADGYFEMCPACGADKKNGHDDDCAMGRLVPSE